MKLSDIASLVNGEIIGPPKAYDVEITGVSGIHDAQEGDISFIASQKYLKELSACKASCVIVKEPLPDITVAQLKVLNPHLAFAKLIEHFHVKPKLFLGISDGSMIAEHCHIADDVTIFPFSYISGGVTIGSGTIIYTYVFTLLTFKCFTFCPFRTPANPSG